MVVLCTTIIVKMRIIIIQLTISGKSKVLAEGLSEDNF